MERYGTRFHFGFLKLIYCFQVNFIETDAETFSKCVKVWQGDGKQLSLYKTTEFITDPNKTSWSLLFRPLLAVKLGFKVKGQNYRFTKKELKLGFKCSSHPDCSITLSAELSTVVEGRSVAWDIEVPKDGCICGKHHNISLPSLSQPYLK